MNDDRITPAWARDRLERLGDARYFTVRHERGLELEYYAPAGSDPQTPHTRDEIYFVIAGDGWFVRDGERRPFGPGEVLFVPAGTPHHFESFSPDFATWAIFKD